MGYLLQNFKCSIIQRRDPDAEENFMPEGGRPCKAEIQSLYGATDRGITTAWAMPCEKTRHKVYPFVHYKSSHYRCVTF